LTQEPYVPRNPRLALQLVLQDLAERWPMAPWRAVNFIETTLMPAIRAAHAHPTPQVILSLTEEQALAVAHVLDGGLDPGSLEVAREVAVELREEVRARREEAD
jgi:hypothetical protein